MKSDGKLKPVDWRPFILVTTLSGGLLLSLFIVLRIILEEGARFQVYGWLFCGFGLFNLILWIKERNLISFTLMLAAFVLAASYLLDYRAAPLLIPLLVLLAGYGALLIWDLAIERRFRRILELAAATVDEAENGFASRPFPAGSVDVDRRVLFRFARFLNRHAIVFSYAGEWGIRLALKYRSRLMRGRPRESRDSYVDIGYDGRVSVHIARGDYRKYQERLTFHSLCRSLGELILSFYEDFRRGEEQRILERIGQGG